MFRILARLALALLLLGPLAACGGGETASDTETTEPAGAEAPADAAAEETGGEAGAAEGTAGEDDKVLVKGDFESGGVDEWSTAEGVDDGDGDGGDDGGTGAGGDG